MTKRAIILTFLILLGWTSFSAGQGSAQATMQVSVRVVSGTSVEVTQIGFIPAKGKKASLGVLAVKGINQRDILVHNTSKLILKNKHGDKLTLNILSQLEENAAGIQNIHFKGISKDDMVRSIYSGELATTIEYM